MPNWNDVEEGETIESIGVMPDSPEAIDDLMIWKKINRMQRTLNTLIEKLGEKDGGVQPSSKLNIFKTYEKEELTVIGSEIKDRVREEGFIMKEGVRETINQFGYTRTDPSILNIMQNLSENVEELNYDARGKKMRQGGSKSVLEWTGE